MIVLDTHALVWWATEPERLSRRASAALRAAQRGSGVAIASVTLWELAMHLAAGRIVANDTSERWIARLVDQTGVSVRELTPAIAVLATQFPADYPRDPADRIIGATARAEGARLVTRDERIRACALIETIW